MLRVSLSEETAESSIELSIFKEKENLILEI